MECVAGRTNMQHLTNQYLTFKFFFGERSGHISRNNRHNIRVGLLGGTP